MHKLARTAMIASVAVTVTSCGRAAQCADLRGVELADLTWVEAEAVLTPDAVVVIALGAASKEHGPHLRLDNDFQMAEYLKRRVLEVAGFHSPRVRHRP